MLQPAIWDPDTQFDSSASLRSRNSSMPLLARPEAGDLGTGRCHNSPLYHTTPFVYLFLATNILHLINLGIMQLEEGPIAHVLTVSTSTVYRFSVFPLISACLKTLAPSHSSSHPCLQCSPARKSAYMQVCSCPARAVPAQLKWIV